MSLLEKVLDKFLPIADGGRASRQLDVTYGIPDKYLVTLTNEERYLVIDLLKEKLE